MNTVRTRAADMGKEKEETEGKRIRIYIDTDEARRYAVRLRALNTGKSIPEIFNEIIDRLFAEELKKYEEEQKSKKRKGG